MESFRRALEHGLSEMGWEIPDGVIERSCFYARMLTEWNERMNLTAIRNEEEVAIKHFVDSLTSCSLWPIPTGERWIDVGTGAGFPGLVVKLWNPGVSLTLLDAVKKRVVFLEAVVEELGLTNVQVVHGRAEDLGKERNFRETFDVAVARAVAQLSVLTELCVPFVRVGGRFIAMKGGSDSQEELAAADTALRVLGASAEERRDFILPRNMGARRIFIFRKDSRTPSQYPRRAGVPAKSPLIGASR